jgi:hypothetical protein
LKRPTDQELRMAAKSLLAATSLRRQGLERRASTSASSRRRLRGGSAPCTHDDPGPVRSGAPAAGRTG